ncbi:cellulose biosynthesis protein BcsG [Salinisphaera sp. P385]|uniref:Cellulose biosynthesis protein BcsG n=1 Tax=Spectribacter acetivorans TaxID=3075603 RepID=A0ABU3B891_9GAMM|nr:cellulose biosynthesis protein BcsG [Salinisphaera sp. P385]MDT0618686.1 cellulose biosynthesis protein BcsG [Salinisphaera sp. P385]
MGWWAFYFLTKLAAFASGSIGFHWRLNLALALFVLLPLQGARRWVQQIIAVAAGIALLYHDAHLPPVSRVFGQLGVLADFDLTYMLELAGRFIGPLDIMLIAVLALGYWLLSAKLRMSSFALLGILLVPTIPMVTTLLQPTTAPTMAQAGSSAGEIAGTVNQSPEAQLEAFYQAESQRRATLNPATRQAQPFDVVFLHICSMAWDDLDLYGMANHPLLQRRDIGFEAFNTAATYSGPASLRLMRATCGQPPHDALYSPADDGCLLFEQLEANGFRPQLMTNWGDSAAAHDFIPNLRKLGGLDAPQRPFGDAPVTMRTYDGEALYSDDALLDAWRADRRQNPDQAVALYYDTTSLHDGNRLVEQPRASSIATYPDRMRRLLDDLNAFIDALATADRRTVVIMVPEHGGAMRGDALQIRGLRELPTPATTLAPVGIYLLGGDAPPREPVRVTSPTSYFALGTLLERFLAEDPFADDAPPLSRYTENLPATRPVSVNEGVVIMRAGDHYWRRDVNGNWSVLETGLGRAAELLNQPAVPLSPTATVTSPDTDRSVAAAP